jgi:aspartyl-tRNA(Asn)/glutamyl-tRNA(Gln) amidotransferase subunit A
MKTLEALAQDLESGRTTAATLVETALERIKDGAGEGARTFLRVDDKGARETAQYVDGLRRRNTQPSRYAGIPISVKDLFDVAGEVTTVGSVVLKDQPPAQADAPAVARLKAKGFIIIGRTNMTEFAYSGVGLNPHYGTPLSPFDRATRRIPGGSSSGAAVSVSDGMCALGLGTDTGGSCRIPASFCGVVGYKPSTGRVPTRGVYPLSRTLDSVGSLGRSVACVALADAVMAEDWDGNIGEAAINRLRIGIPDNLDMGGLEGNVAKSFERAMKRLRDGGCRIEKIAFPSIDEISAINSKGGISAIEAFTHHRELILSKGDLYDPRVGRRILNGSTIPAYEYLEILRVRGELIARVKRLLSGFDGLLMPTTPNVPPPVAALKRDEEYTRINFLSLKHTFAGNFLDLCAISLPMHEPGGAPCGLMIMAPWGSDQALFAAAAAVERDIAEDA